MEFDSSKSEKTHQRSAGWSIFLKDTSRLSPSNSPRSPKIYPDIDEHGMLKKDEKRGDLEILDLKEIE